MTLLPVQGRRCYKGAFFINKNEPWKTNKNYLAEEKKKINR